NRYFNWDIINFINMEELRDALQEPKNKIILLTLGSVFLSTLILILIYRSLYVRLTNLSDHVEKLDQENFSKQFTGSQGEDEIGKLIKAFNRMVVKIKMLITDVYDAKLERSNIKLEKKQAELNALQSQLKPHFLFNTLESIRMKSLEKKENETADIIKYLARSFRRMISHEQEWVKVSDEVTYIKDFLKIQKYRFGSEFEFSLEIDPEALNIQIPKLTIQPLVENGCVHGIERSEEKGQINVSIRIVDNKLICNIEDNGIGISRERLDYMFSRVKDDKEAGDNIGLINIYKRLDLYYGDEFDLKIKSKEGKGTSVTLIMPLGSEYF
ncbi:MAG: sensor histidine kinase, partial [bacterium]